MTATSTIAPIYQIEDIIPVFREPPFGFLPRDLTILAGGPVPGEAGLPRRLAFSTFNEDGDIVLKIIPAGFTKEELIDLREAAEPLREGCDIQICGRSHGLALFASGIFIEDSEVQAVNLVFELDPFA